MKKLLTSFGCLGCLLAAGQNSDIFKGGAGDGSSFSRYMQSSPSIWTGGQGDGASSSSYAQNTISLWLGGQGDGVSTSSYAQNAINFWLGGQGDGFASENYVQQSDNIWLGGAGDGWASTYTPTIPLPVSLLNFDADKIAGKFSKLTWTTSLENNHQRFDVERSIDGVNFVKIHTIHGSGASQSNKNYTWIDSLPVHGYNYYRLKQIDIDGAFNYSPARMVHFADALISTIKVSPNPATNWIMVELPTSMQKENSVINIVSLKGEVVAQLKVPSNSSNAIKLNVGHLSRSMYMIHIVSKNHTEVTRILLQ